MYHCHFEDVEHVQMGMTSIVYVRPSQNGTTIGGYNRFAYYDGDGSTGYNREFALLLDEIWTTPHDNLEAIQETVWPDYKANYWTINGRSYPDTVVPNGSADPVTFELTPPPGRPELVFQPNSSLIQVNPGDRALLRLANLGYEQHAMQLPGIRMRVVGEDAALLRNGAVDLSYLTNTVYIGPGEARDVLFTAPAFDASAPTATDSVGAYNIYLFKNRSLHALTNGGAPGLGGMVTEVRVYQGSPLPPQTAANQTYV
jgi:FtsP/CotA-like multicopper oxidase with cupredoxin domain